MILHLRMKYTNIPGEGLRQDEAAAMLGAAAKAIGLIAKVPPLPNGTDIIVLPDKTMICSNETYDISKNETTHILSMMGEKS